MMLMFLTKKMLIAIIIAVAIVFVVCLVYLLLRSHRTNQQVKVSSRNNELLFLANVQAARRNESSEAATRIDGFIPVQPQKSLSDFAERPLSIKDPKPIISAPDDVPSIPEEPVTKRLSDFFEP